MCSTIKLLAGGAVLVRVDQEGEHLDRIVRFTQKDIVSCSSVTQTRVGDVGMSIREVCAAAITMSDNTAGNLLLRSVRRTRGLTAFARSLGDDLTRLNRWGTDLNEALPGDPRDTSTPAVMLADLRALVLGNVLSLSSKALLTEWLTQNQTGNERLRASLPAAWKVGDKTGAGERGTTYDLAIIWPPQRSPVLVTIYLTGAKVDSAGPTGFLAAIGRSIASMGS